MVQAGHKSSGKNDWETPWDIFNHWNDRFQFELDVCASASNFKCPLFLTEDDDALKHEWKSRNWMNPPYGDGLIEPFVKKAYEQGLLGRLTVGLLPASNATLWWTRWVRPADHIYYYTHRISFLNNGVSADGNNGGNAIVIWGLHPQPRLEAKRKKK